VTYQDEALSAKQLGCLREKKFAGGGTPGVGRIGERLGVEGKEKFFTKFTKGEGGIHSKTQNNPCTHPRAGTITAGEVVPDIGGSVRGGLLGKEC